MPLAKPDALFTWAFILIVRFAVDLPETFLGWALVLVAVRVAVNLPEALFRWAFFAVIKAFAVDFPLAFVLFGWAPFFVGSQRCSARVVVLPLAPFFWTPVYRFKAGAVWFCCGPGVGCGWRG